MKKLRKNDQVVVISGAHKGKMGRIIKIDWKRNKVVVEKVNIVKKHLKPNPYTGQSGGIIEKEAPIHISNVLLFCESCSRPTRVGYKFTEDGKKLRYCKKCKELLD